jgi:hypothetical protein
MQLPAGPKERGIRLFTVHVHCWLPQHRYTFALRRVSLSASPVLSAFAVALPAGPKERGIRLFTVHVRRGPPDVQDPGWNSLSKLNCISACIQVMQRLFICCCYVFAGSLTECL